MRIPYSWLRDTLETGSPGFALSAEELEEALLSIGHEVEAVHTLGPVSGPVTIGRVVEIEELSGFKKPIRACRVDVGDDQPRDIVCGATNFAVGDLVVAALPGAVLPGDFAIASRKTYGRTSDGMICSAAELRLSAEHSGILVLPAATAPPGADAAAVLGLDDVVYELAITPDRGYCMSVRGLARDIACALNLDYQDPASNAVVPQLPADGPAWPLKVQPGTGVRRFALRAVSGIDSAAVSPWWLQRRLMLCGIRAIGPAVDVTNYVMVELGHPMHAHDRDRITGGLQVRFATDDEAVTTLDGVQRHLVPTDVLIVDDEATAAIGGVMGSGTTEIRTTSTNVLLESAIWDPASVSRTARRLHLPSEAARRYERGVDPAISVAALNRGAALLAEIAGGVVEPGLTDWCGEPPAEHFNPAPVDIAADLPDRIAGVRYPAGTTTRRLTQIGCTVTADGDTVSVTPPSWRPDLRQPADLVEEVLRLEGLHSIPSVLPTAPAGRGLTEAQRRRRSIGTALAWAGYVEVLSSPFLPAGVFDAWGLAADDPRRVTVSVLNPLESDRAQLSSTLLPALLETLVRNVSRGISDVALFTIAQVVQPAGPLGALAGLALDRKPTDAELDALDQALPRQPQHLAVVLAGLAEPRGPFGPGRPVEAADAIEAARIVARAAGAEVTLRAAAMLPWHPGRCAQLSVEETVIGYAGQLHPAVIERLGLPAGTCAVEVNLDAIPLATALPAPRVSPYPAVFQDLAVVVDDQVSAQAVADALREGAGALLESIALFDIYVGPQIGEGRKSLAFALRFRAADRTLAEEEASAARDAAVRCAAERVGATLRS